MRKFFVFSMYLMWIITIILIVTTTLLDFKYEDINLLALILFSFSLLNTFFLSTKK